MAKPLQFFHIYGNFLYFLVKAADIVTIEGDVLSERKKFSVSKKLPAPFCGISIYEVKKCILS
jgi:hypothetical protein